MILVYVLGKQQKEFEHVKLIPDITGQGYFDKDEISKIYINFAIPF